MTFYIPEFACGVIVTILCEFVICIAAAAISSINKEKGDGSNAEKDIPIPTSTYNRDGTENESTGKNH